MNNDFVLVMHKVSKDSVASMIYAIVDLKHPLVTAVATIVKGLYSCQLLLLHY